METISEYLQELNELHSKFDVTCKSDNYHLTRVVHLENLYDYLFLELTEDERRYGILDKVWEWLLANSIPKTIKINHYKKYIEIICKNDATIKFEF